MFEKEVVVISDSGVHARPAMMLVKIAMEYPCEVFLVKDEVEANAKSIMGVLSLAITSGSKIVIRTDGENEEEAATKIADLIESNFNNAEQ